MKNAFLPFLALFLLTACTQTLELNKGEDVVRAMYETYGGEWFKDFNIKQKVTYYQQDTVVHTEIWDEIISLPAKVRSIIGNTEDGNCEIYHDQAYHRFVGGKLANVIEGNHHLLSLGFDVYLQKPEKTLEDISGAGFDMSVVSDTLIDEREVLIVGALPGQEDVPQFWVDKERMLLVRISLNSGSGSLYTVDLLEYVPFEEGWISTYLIFSRHGRVLMEENYLDFGVMKEIPEHTFTTDTLYIVE